ncbi:MAG TPA: DUF1801 domain-containing protein [Candidatus Limnocylindrales bacterium]
MRRTWVGSHADGDGCRFYRRLHRRVPGEDAESSGRDAGDHQCRGPGATELISYSMPTFDLNGHHLVHFAGHTNHVGLYPIPSGIEAFKEELAPHKQGKGSVQFPLAQPLPADLIRRIVEFRVGET